MGDVLHIGAAVAGAKALCVFVHGRGQNPEAMLDHVVRHLPQDVAYVLPRAPGGSWYGARAVDALTEVTRRELGASLAQVEALIANLRRASGAPVLLAGFSQGGCLSLELASAGRARPDAVAALTGCRVGLVGDERPRAAAAGLPVYLTGGDRDPWIPLTAFAEAAADLGGQGVALRADLFPGRAHEVSAAEISMVAAMLGDLGAGRSPRMEAPR